MSRTLCSSSKCPHNELEAPEEEQRVLLILIYTLCLGLAVLPYWSRTSSVGV